MCERYKFLARVCVPTKWINLAEYISLAYLFLKQVRSTVVWQNCGLFACCIKYDLCFVRRGVLIKLSNHPIIFWCKLYNDDRIIGVTFPGRANLKAPRLVLELNKFSIQWLPGSFLPGSKSCRDVNIHLLPRLGKCGSIPPLSLKLSWHSFLLKDRYSFRFFTFVICPIIYACNYYRRSCVLPVLTKICAPGRWDWTTCIGTLHTVLYILDIFRHV